MKTWLIIDKTLPSIILAHDSESKPFFVEFAEGKKYTTRELPEDIKKEEATVYLEDGELVIDENSSLRSTRVQSERDAKLEELRAARAEKLKAMDHMVNQLVLGLRDDNEAIKNYRQALLDCTGVWKKLDGHARATIDNLDLEDFEWPSEP